MQNVVVDTSVFLSDPLAMERLGNKDVIIPLVVLTELEAKRTHPELGYPARIALRHLESLRLQYGSLTEPIPTPEGGSIRVEINNVNKSGLPSPFQTSENDNRILAVAHNMGAALMTKDLPLRLKASVLGIGALDYTDNEGVDADWGGVVEIKVDQDVIEEIYDTGSVWVEESIVYPINTGVILRGQSSALGIIKRSGRIESLKEKAPMGLAPKNAEQTIAVDLLCDPNVGIVSLGGLAGSGKTVMALAAGLAAVNTGVYKKVVVFRTVNPVGSQELGFLPGTAEEKMAPWAEAVYDALESFMKSNEIRDLRGKLEILPLTHIRGRTLKDSYVIIDEAQNLDIMVLVTALSRLGEGSKVVMTHDVNQRDNLRVGKYDGIARVISTLSESDLFAHVSLHRSERSKIADLVSRSFDL